MDSLIDILERKPDPETDRIPIAKKCIHGTYFSVNNIITWIEFQWTLAYECLVDKIDLWGKLPEIDKGNEWYFINEIKRCTHREVIWLKTKLATLISLFSETEENISFLIKLQNACTNIINSHK